MIVICYLIGWQSRFAGAVVVLFFFAAIVPASYRAAASFFSRRPCRGAIVIVLHRRPPPHPRLHCSAPLSILVALFRPSQPVLPPSSVVAVPIVFVFILVAAFPLTLALFQVQATCNTCPRDGARQSSCPSNLDARSSVASHHLRLHTRLPGCHRHGTSVTFSV